MRSHVAAVTASLALAAAVIAPGCRPGDAEGPPPVANAGADQSVTKGRVVTLDGSQSSTSAKSSLIYAWTQTSGTAVELSAADAASPTFTAPGVSGTLEFSLVVSDGANLSLPDAVRVVVGNPSKCARTRPSTSWARRTNSLASGGGFFAISASASIQRPMMRCSERVVDVKRFAPPPAYLSTTG